MAKFKRHADNGNGGNSEVYSVGLNIVLTGSKQMQQAEIEALLSTSAVKVTITDADNPNRILVDQTVDAAMFKTGSVGFGLHGKGFEFQEAA